MAAPAAITMLVQAAHQIVALYFVSTIVTDAIAGVRVLPGLAISLAAAPIAGQNFGAGNYSRVRALFRTTGVLNNAVMIVVTMLVLWQPQALLHFFQDGYCVCRNCDLVLTADVVDARSAGTSVYTCSFMFQALGKDIPALLSAVVCVVTFSLPAIWLSYQPAFHTDQVWLLLTASIGVQAAVSLWLLQVEFKRKL